MTAVIVVLLVGAAICAPPFVVAWLLVRVMMRGPWGY